MLNLSNPAAPVRDLDPDILSAMAWIGKLGGSPVKPQSFAASPVLAVGHFRFDGLAEEVEAPQLPFHYISVSLGAPLVIEARLGGEKVKARVLPGQSLIMAAERSNIWRWDGPTEEAHVFLHADFLEQVAVDAGQRRAEISDRLAFTDTRLRHTILALTEEMQRHGSIPTLFFDMAADVLARRILFRHCESDGKSRPSSSTGALTARQLRRVLAVVEDRLSHDISLDDLASAAGLSRFHFVRAFKTAVGTPPHRWLVRLRIERAKELLLCRTATIIEVAALVGFESQSHFGQVFLSQVGVPPSEWRRRALS
ncbi:helix-turn-helix domain-containing protein [Hyphomicrobium sp. 99]|uniref:helix-turn-helix domain-containing protein n=1 Tax=Hyphomicrobium sp. 99 TaxID=1163419 RepID=UPI0005F8126C|nr:AraC family transcriptional regulator [Hyphomicrobium sp. 99]